MHVCFTQIKEREAAALGYSLLAKAVMRAVSVVSAVSVVKADRVQGGACTKRDTEVFLWLILAPLKSIIARVYLKKKPLYSWFPHTDKYTKLFTKNIPEYFAHG